MAIEPRDPSDPRHVEACRLRASGVTIVALAEMFGVSKNTIKNWIQPEFRSYIKRKRYGIDNEVYSDMLAEQNNRCAICKEELNKPYIDHDHTTGEVRGLLCNNCNCGLGQFKDSVQSLEAAINYLRKDQ